MSLFVLFFFLFSCLELLISFVSLELAEKMLVHCLTVSNLPLPRPVCYKQTRYLFIVIFVRGGPVIVEQMIVYCSS